MESELKEKSLPPHINLATLDVVMNAYKTQIIETITKSNELVHSSITRITELFHDLKQMMIVKYSMIDDHDIRERTVKKYLLPREQSNVEMVNKLCSELSINDNTYTNPNSLNDQIIAPSDVIKCELYNGSIVIDVNTEQFHDLTTEQIRDHLQQFVEPGMKRTDHLPRNIRIDSFVYEILSLFGNIPSKISSILLSDPRVAMHNTDRYGSDDVYEHSHTVYRGEPMRGGPMPLNAETVYRGGSTPRFLCSAEPAVRAMGVDGSHIGQHYSTSNVDFNSAVIMKFRYTVNCV
jgi:hypothetical protein